MNSESLDIAVSYSDVRPVIVINYKDWRDDDDDYDKQFNSLLNISSKLRTLIDNASLLDKYEAILNTAKKNNQHNIQFILDDYAKTSFVLRQHGFNSMVDFRKVLAKLEGKLSAIKSYVDILQNGDPENEDAQKILNKIDEIAEW